MALELEEMPYVARVVADELTQGAPTHGWRGDKRLSLHLGVLVASSDGYRKGKWYRAGDPVATRYEVHRHNEDGTDTPLIYRDMDKLHEIIPKLVSMDPATPGHEEVMDIVERDNASVERQNSRDFADSYGGMIDHMWSIMSEREGKHTIRQVGGRDERPDRNLA